ncbi:hypothetical protein, partial [Falsigemmobacter intermedius]|uniref:hypothetical protein n=1 Tax=Falsigemmobacter intermedius TaxID=1553448 RepID=UPI003F124E4F
EKDGSYLQWGNFRPLAEEQLTVRSERALYGLSGEYRSTDVTPSGESRHRVTGFVAAADSLMQRDVLRGTGGSAYFLSRQDILSGSEALWIELRSRTTGLVVERRRLVEDTDYRINPVQGAIFLTSPLSPSQQGGGLVTSSPSGDYDVNLVVQYEYIPTTGVVDGHTAGVRGETWVSDELRVGVSVLRETTGIADSRLGGADLLWQGAENRHLLLEYARSEGPGFNSRFSINGGLDLDPVRPDAGQLGRRATSLRMSGQTDLAALGLQGEVKGYIDRKDAGFSTFSESFDYDQTAWGLEGRVAVAERTELTFGGEELRRDDGRLERIARIGFAHQLDANRMIEAEIANDHHDAISRADDFGARTDAGLRLTWTRDEDLKAWIFGQTTLSRDATRRSNDRLGAGVQIKVSERTDLLVEGSDGSLGAAGRVELGFRPNDRSRMTLGYELDPMRRYDSVAFRGRDRGNLVFGLTSEMNERWSYVTEARYSALGSRPSLAAGYGLTYTPSEAWKFDALIQEGETREEGGFTLKRRGLSLGAKHQQGEEINAGLRAEWHRERSNLPDNRFTRNTWLVSGNYDVKISEDWRFVSALDSQLSKSDQSSFRDGRYIEARLGYAWRPAASDHLNGLISYTYLQDLPGADQVNIDGEVEGPRQKSHILNAAISWKADPLWTLGAKYGYRLRRSADRGTDTYVRSEAHLAVLRADFHVIHNWDVMGEVRGLWTPASGRTETTALLGVYRLFGDQFRIGGGYLHGRVSDDLRRVKAPRTGFFVNITSQF